MKVGFDSATHVTETMLRTTSFWEDNRFILEQPRGAGYWLWKPWIVLQKLRECGPDDIVIYNDAGRHGRGSFNPFPAFPHAAIELCAMTPKRFIHGFIGSWQVQGQYTKRDAFVLMDADTDEMRLASQVCAGPLLFMPSAESFAFLEEWVDYCRDPRIITDQPDEMAEPFEEFLDNRHDQSVGSILAHQRKAHYFDFSKAGAHLASKAVTQRNPHVMRPQTHIGYVSLMAAEVLPDDFLQRDQPDLSLLTGLLRNLQPDEPVPVHRDRPNPDRMLTELAEFLDQPGGRIAADHLRALLAKKKFSNWRGFHLRKFPEEAARHWQIAVAHFITDVRNRHAAGEVLDLSSAIPLVVTALRHADAEMPELRRLVMARFLWNRLSSEARQSFTDTYKRYDKGKGADVMGRFCDMLHEQDLISFEFEMQGVPKDATEVAGPLMMDWLAAEAQTPANSQTPPDEDTISA